MNTIVQNKLRNKLQAKLQLDKLTSKVNNDPRVLIARNQLRNANENLTIVLAQVQKEQGWLDQWIKAEETNEDYIEAKYSEMGQ